MVTHPAIACHFVIYCYGLNYGWLLFFCLPIVYFFPEPAVCVFKRANDSEAIPPPLPYGYKAVGPPRSCDNCRWTMTYAGALCKGFTALEACFAFPGRPLTPAYNYLTVTSTQPPFRASCRPKIIFPHCIPFVCLVHTFLISVSVCHPRQGTYKKVLKGGCHPPVCSSFQPSPSMQPLSWAMTHIINPGKHPLSLCSRETGLQMTFGGKAASEFGPASSPVL